MCVKACVLLYACTSCGFVALIFESFQFLVVAWRSGLKMWRNPMTNILQVSVYSVHDKLLIDALIYSFL